MYVRAWVHIESARPVATDVILWFSVAALFWLASAFVPAPFNYLLWVVGMGVDLMPLILPGARERRLLVPFDLEHLSERFGIFTIIVLGESFIKIITKNTSIRMTWPIFWFSCGGLTVTYGLWWLYFDDVAGSKLDMSERRNFAVWLFSHLPLAIGITAFGMAAKKLIFSESKLCSQARISLALCRGDHTLSDRCGVYRRGN